MSSRRNATAPRTLPLRGEWHAALVAGVVVAALAVAAAGHVPPGYASGTALYVSPTGSDSNNGLTARTPLKSVQLALDRASAGTTINLAPGAYVGDLATSRSGTASAPITVRGTDDPRGATAHRTVVYGSSHVIDVNHSHYTFTGFSVDGQQALEAAYRTDHPKSVSGYPDPAALAADPTTMTRFKNTYQSSVKDGRLIYVGATATNLTGVIVDNMFLQGGGGECIRLRNSTTHSTVSNSVIRYCGLFAKPSTDRYVYHNGEGVYLGTSPKSTTQPQAGRDATNDNTVARNTIWTYGSECVDVKEVAARNTVTGNDCGYNLEPSGSDGSNIEVRGDHNAVAQNQIHDSLGWNVKLVSDSSSYDRGGNSVTDNTMTTAASGVSLYSQQSGVTACGNTMSGTAQGPGTSGATAACELSATPSAKPSATPSPTPSATPSPTPSVTPSPSLQPASIALEAESGTVVAPITVQSDPAAQGGRYVVQSATSRTGSVTFRFSVAVSGSYLLRARVIAPDGSHNSFYRAVDGSSPTAWALPDSLTAWAWTSGPTLSLGAGSHMLVVSRRESGTRLDALTLVLLPG